MVVELNYYNSTPGHWIQLSLGKSINPGAPGLHKLLIYQCG